MIRWAAFVHNGTTYDLSHLHPSKEIFLQAATSTQPERTYSVNVSYSLHCFSRKFDEAADRKLSYADAREIRTFDFKRYELSKQLPAFIKNLGPKKCFHSGHGNFCLIELVTPDGKKEDYEVYFNVTKTRTSGIALYVQTAYARDIAHPNRPSRKQKISFFVILYNTLYAKEIKIPPQK